MDRWSEVFSDEYQLSLAPALRANVLRQHGLLQPKVSGRLRWSWVQANVTMEMEAVWDCERGVLTINDRRENKVVYEVGVDRLATGRQQQVFFVDGQNGRRFKTLYFYRGRFGTREAFGIKYPSQRLTPADLRETALQRPDVYQAPWPTPPDPDFIAPPLPRRRAGRETRYAYWSAEIAIRYGGPLSDDDAKIIVGMTAAFLSDHLERPAPTMPQVSPTEHLEIGIWELQPRLDVFSLQRAGLLKDGEQTLFRLHYEHDRSKLTDVIVCVDLRSPSRPCLVMHNYFENFDRSERHLHRTYLELTPPDDTPQRRRYIICPFSAQRVDAVAYRAGVWGSKAALRLENASQRSERYVDRIFRASVDAPRVPEKPAKRQPRLRHHRR